MTFLLQTEQLAYRYPQNHKGLSPVSMDVLPGEMWLVTGPSGCGKSTLARCLTGLIPHLYHGHMEGRVCLDGLDTARVPLWKLTERAGLLFQNPASQMLASTVEGEITFGLENLGLSRKEIQARLEQALIQFDLVPLRARSPAHLSGGEQQKLALAAVLARRPALLVLDEPFSMLDSTASFELLTYLISCAQRGTSWVMCEHHVEHMRDLQDLRTLQLGNGAVEKISRASLHRELCPLPKVPPFSLEVERIEAKLGGRVVLQDLSLSVPAGQIVAIVGRNGVGKTTLLRAMMGLQNYSGNIHVDGKQPDLAMMFQNPDIQLFNPTVHEEILYKLATPDMARYRWLLQTLGLAAYESTPPLLLSEGEKKRVALATALMRAPRHGLLLDEPSLGQDDAHKVHLMTLARALANAGHVVIMTTHDLALAVQADRIMLLGAEGFVADGSPAQVLRDQGAWATLGLRLPDWINEGGDEPA